jgi:membrane protease YdiL (CAAX protease family)
MEEKNIFIKKRIAVFVVLTYAISWIVFMLIPILGLTYGGLGSIIIAAAAMFVPASCSILTRLITKEGFGNLYLRPHLKGNIKKYLLIFFGPTALLFMSAAVYFLIFPGIFDPELTVLNGMAASKNSAGLSVNMLLLVTVLQVAIIGPVINIIPTLGEELGWRGYLLPKLRSIVSDRTALIITGVIWGLWHAPIIAMGHNYGTEYIGYPWLGILIMIVFCVVLGVIEGYATIRMESVIPAAMIHSLVNAGAGFPILLAKGGANPLLGPSITGLAGMIPFAVVAVVLLIKAGKGIIASEREEKPEVEV